MHLVQLLLPLYDNSGNVFSETVFSGIRGELTEGFGGVTAFTSAPAQGLWISEGGTTHDEIVVVEVMTSDLDCEWWASYRARLEMLLKQKHIVFRAQSIVLLQPSRSTRGWSGAKICWKPVVNVGSRDRGVSGRDCQLMQISHYVSYRINALYRGLLMGIHLQGSYFCTLGS
jgi:hypothetical protein